MMFGWTLLLVLLVLAVWLTVSRRGSRPSGGEGGPASDDGAEETLRKRYARGEIDEETYQKMLEELRRR